MVGQNRIQTARAGRGARFAISEPQGLPAARSDAAAGCESEDIASADALAQNKLRRFFLDEFRIETRCAIGPAGSGCGGFA